MGRILVVFTIVLVTLWTATQWTAWRLGYPPQLGPPWFVLAAPVPAASLFLVVVPFRCVCTHDSSRVQRLRLRAVSSRSVLRLTCRGAPGKPRRSRPTARPAGQRSSAGCSALTGRVRPTRRRLSASQRSGARPVLRPDPLREGGRARHTDSPGLAKLGRRPSAAPSRWYACCSTRSDGD